MSAPRRPSQRRSLTTAAASTTVRPAVEDIATPPAPEEPPAPKPTPRRRATRKAPAAAPRSPETAVEPAGVKYTAVLDLDSVEAFESVTRVARRRLGRHVDKVEVLRALLLLAGDDASLRDQVISSLDRR